MKKLHSLPILLHSLIVLFGLSIPGNAQRAPGRSTMAPALIVFGDSIVDPGNNNGLSSVIKCNFPPYGRDFVSHRPTGRFCNGKIPSDFIASSLGIKELLPAYLDPNLTAADLLTGVSFASGGSGYDNLTSTIASVLSLKDQIELFKEYKRKLQKIAGKERAAAIVSESVYISITGTDDIANTYFSTPFRRTHYSISSYTYLLANAAYDFYQELYAQGARKIGVAGLPPVGCVPSQRSLAGGITRACVPLYNRAARILNAKLSNKVQMLSSSLPSSNIIYIDIYKTLDNLIQRPSEYGFQVSNRGCCGTGNVEVAILCNPATPPCPNPSKYVFWDSYHPTEGAYKIITQTLFQDYIRKLL